jgi:hypothetical protein
MENPTPIQHTTNTIEKFIKSGPESLSEYKQIDLDEDSSISDMEFDQYNGLDYLYNIEPQSQNLWYAGYFCEAGDGTPSNSMKMFYNARYRIKKVTIPFPSLEVEYHSELRSPLVKGTQYQNEITIDWFEDVYHSVQKYHLDWFNRWYTKDFDCFRCGIQGKFRKMAVIAFHYVNGNNDSIIPVPKIEPLFAFIIGGLIPKNLPAITWDYNSDGNDSLVSMTYHCNTIRWAYNHTIGFGDTKPKTKVDALFDTNKMSEALNAADGMSTNIPFVRGSSDNKISNETGETKLLNAERIRIIRSATYYQASEAAL